ncbi:MAG: hypothetical protein Q9182_007446 [Xanthomendoza sp. 2 TL-2023]
MPQASPKMVVLQILWAFILNHLATACAASISSPNNIYAPAGDDKPGVVALRRPVPIPGFEVRVSLDKTSTLNTKAIITHAVQFMARLAGMDQDYRINTGVVISEPGWPEEIYAANFPLTQHNGFQVRHVVIALYDASVAVSRRLTDRPGYLPIVTASLYIRGTRKGILGMRRMLHGHTQLTNQTSISQANNETLSAQSGVAIDLDDPKFRIAWKTNGDSFDPTDLWTALMDALATAAAYDSEHLGAAVVGIAASGNAEIDFHGILPSSGLPPAFKWRQLVRAINVLWGHHVLYPECNLGMDFLVSYDGVNIAVGDTSVRRAGRGVESSKH